MATSKTYEGTTYSIPAQGELNWFGSTKVDGFLIALADNVPQKTGGTFTLSADLNLGSTAHLKGIFKTTTALPATTGMLRLANTDTIGWRNAANSANITLQVNASDQLAVDTAVLVTVSAGPALTLKDSGTFATDANPYMNFSDTAGIGASLGFLTANSNVFTIQNARSSTVAINAGGVTSCQISSTTVQILNGSVSAPSLAFLNDTDCGFYYVNTPEVVCTVAGSNALRVQGTGLICGTGATNVHDFNTASQTTVGAAGAASALPATPTGYWEVKINGTSRVVPFYAKS